MPKKKNSSAISVQKFKTFEELKAPQPRTHSLEESKKLHEAWEKMLRKVYALRTKKK